MSKRREVPRYLCDLTAEVLPKSGSRLNATVTILSIKGCCLEGVGPLDHGQEFQVNTEWCGKDLRAEAEVVWKNNQQVGCRFVSLSDNAMGIIREMLMSLPLLPLQPPRVQT